HAGWNFAVLALAAAFEFYSWRISYKELRAQKDPEESTWEEIIGSKNPVIFTVFLEDTAGMIGAGLAFLGILLGQVFHNDLFDALASIRIRPLHAGAGIVLGRESGPLLVGERRNRSIIRRIREMLQNDPSVEAVGHVLTIQLGPEEVLLTVDIRFRRGANVQ